MQKGNGKAALEFFEQALAYLQSAVDANPNAMVYQRDCAIAHERLGDALRKVGNSNEAAEHFKAGLAMVEPIAEDNPRDEKARSVRASLNCHLGELAMAELDWDQAADYFGSYLKIAIDNVRLAPDDVKARRELGVAHYKFVELHRKRAESVAETPGAQITELRQAQAACRAALAVFDEMVEDQVLRPSDAGVPAMLHAELTALNKRLGAMDAPARSESADEAVSSTP